MTGMVLEWVTVLWMDLLILCLTAHTLLRKV